MGLIYTRPSRRYPENCHLKGGGRRGDHRVLRKFYSITPAAGTVMYVGHGH